MEINIQCKATYQNVALTFSGFRRFKTIIAERIGNTAEMKPVADNFLLQPEGHGTLPPDTCGLMLKAIEDFDDNFIYGVNGDGYEGTVCGYTLFKDIKMLLEQCVENNCVLIWDCPRI